MTNQDLQQPEESSISGAWILDVSRSDTMEGYLRCMRTPEAAIQMQLSGERAYESRNVIALDETTLTVHRQTMVNDFVETFVLDEEIVSQTRYGSKHVTATLGEGGMQDGFVIASTAATIRGDVDLVEVRQLIGEGRTQSQVLLQHIPATGEQCTTRRTWKRAPLTRIGLAQVTTR